MAPSPTSTFTIAAVQTAPVFLDREATVDKVCRLISTAAEAGAKLIVFPEVLIPAYPDWVWVLPARERVALNALYAELVENAVTIPSETTRRLGEAARLARAFVVIGVNERNAEASGSSLYNTLLFIDSDGNLIGRHRKLVPTGGERLIWGPGDGSTLKVHDTPFGKLGGLICWENYMPLARYAMYAWGIQIHVAATWDRGEPWLSTLRHIAREGRMVVVNCCQAVHRDHIPDRYPFKKLYPEGREWINVGDSAIVDPDGKFIAGPLKEREDILYAEIDPLTIHGARWMFDAAGHYARPDVFEFAVHREPRSIMEVRSQDGGGPVVEKPTRPAPRPRRRKPQRSGRNR